MSLIIPTCEEQIQIEKERMDIIKSIMKIQSVKELHILNVIAKQYYWDELDDLPMTLDEFVSYLDFPMLVRIADLFKGEDSKYLVNRQIKELIANAIDNFTGASEESEDETN